MDFPLSDLLTALTHIGTNSRGMSFGGPIDSMIRSNRENLGKLQGRRKRGKEILQDHPVEYAEIKNPMKFAGIEEKLRFHQRLRRDRKKNQFRFILILGLTIIVLMIILFWVVTADYSSVIDLIS